MRTAIRTRLVEKDLVGDRVYQPHMAGPKLKVPCIVVKMGGENSSFGMKNGYDLPVEVWLYADQTNQTVLDELAAAAINALLRVDLSTSDGQIFSLEYDGCSEDLYDEDWKALTRRLDFATARVREG